MTFPFRKMFTRNTSIRGLDVAKVSASDSTGLAQTIRTMSLRTVMRRRNSISKSKAVVRSGNRRRNSKELIVGTRRMTPRRSSLGHVGTVIRKSVRRGMRRNSVDNTSMRSMRRRNSLDCPTLTNNRMDTESVGDITMDTECDSDAPMETEQPQLPPTRTRTVRFADTAHHHHQTQPQAMSNESTWLDPVEMRELFRADVIAFLNADDEYTDKPESRGLEMYFPGECSGKHSVRTAFMAAVVEKYRDFQDVFEDPMEAAGYLQRYVSILGSDSQKKAQALAHQDAIEARIVYAEGSGQLMQDIVVKA